MHFGLCFMTRRPSSYAQKQKLKEGCVPLSAGGKVWTFGYLYLHNSEHCWNTLDLDRTEYVRPTAELHLPCRRVKRPVVFLQLQ